MLNRLHRTFCRFLSEPCRSNIVNGCFQVVHTYSERMSYRPWKRVFMYDRGQCGSASDIMALTSDQAVTTVDIPRGRFRISLQWLNLLHLTHVTNLQSPHTYFSQCPLVYVAAKATYIRLLYGKRGIFYRPYMQLRKKGSEPYSAWMKYVVCVHLYIP